MLLLLLWGSQFVLLVVEEKESVVIEMIMSLLIDQHGEMLLQRLASLAYIVYTSTCE